MHHKTYERLGCELATDVELLCEVCHEAADGERAKASQERAASARWDARFAGWMRARFGDDWEWMDRFEIEAYEERFEEWLENNDDD